MLKDQFYICREISSTSDEMQTLSERLDLPIDKVDLLIQQCLKDGLLYKTQSGYAVTEIGQNGLDEYQVDNAIILAAGFGSRFVPLTYETPKGLLSVFGKPMLERQIEQLIEMNITEIIIVVGYMKEKMDYLIDKYGVKLVYNPEFAFKNNLTSLYYALPYLKSSYILCADNWMEHNLFHAYEYDSWFSCLYMEGETAEWCVSQVSSEGKIEKIDIGGCDSWTIVGPAFFSRSFSKIFSELVVEYYNKLGTENYYWEHILRENLSVLPMYMNKQQGNVHEFECLEELRAFDPSYKISTNNKIMHYLSELFGIAENKIGDIYPLKEGVTNKSFHYAIDGNEYVFRLPGTGTDKLINRRNEKYVYTQIQPLGLTDEVVAFDEDTGIKISKYYPGTVSADPFNDKELCMCMQQIKRIHHNMVTVEHSVNIQKMISYYLSLAEEIDAIRFTDLDESKKKLDKLFRLMDKLDISEVLCHGDYAHINVLMLPDGSCRIIDWEYSGMGDPIMDVAMYTIFAEFDKERIDLSLRMYLDREPSAEEFIRLYLYVSLSGFLWMVWSEYKQKLGQEFGEYPLVMYRYMKDYYKVLESLDAFENYKKGNSGLYVE